ncbi:uncharacterized protein EI97DRAFT_282527 [Westerdykella ornata]|uniref:Uncharacterized protein n=1 Tax=Westerdykella ornata TaxID=318751 RepID=A0A6A6JNG8_WESOR|nr:uncharacterized protein EI97DRAFT_282527 [Westerdykella ornata]KAF2278062.1 hypothetical protein EI97DRAFT_282527 [Westerdykella ornata]
MGRDALSEKVFSFSDELQRMGCLEDEVPKPNLRNEIHPIFRLDRWMGGYGQPTEEIYPRMKPALRLASLFLTEECTLHWWTHTMLGEEMTAYHDDGSGRTFRYIEANPEEFTPRGRSLARTKLYEMADVIMLMFTPERYKDTRDGKAWGMCSNHSIREFPWAQHFCSRDFPHIPGKYMQDKSRVPEITFSHKFSDFYCNHYTSSSKCQILRVHFMFAMTIMHELAHAFHMFIGKDNGHKEPLHNQFDRYAELGFSWEIGLTGRICNPLFHTLRDVHALFSVRTYTWLPHELEKVAEVQRATRYFRDPESSVRFRAIPIDASLDWVPTHEWRGVQYFNAQQPECPTNYMCIVVGIPMQWVAAWFLEEEWEENRRFWAKHHDDYGSVRRRTLFMGECWSLVYQKDIHGRQSMWVASR